GLAQRIERLEAWGAGRDAASVEDVSGGNLVVLVLLGGEIDQAHTVLRGQGDERPDVRCTAQIGDGADDDLRRVEPARRCRRCEQCRSYASEKRTSASPHLWPPVCGSIFPNVVGINPRAGGASNR